MCHIANFLIKQPGKKISLNGETGISAYHQNGSKSAFKGIPSEIVK
jgi:hypothetical protein